MLVEPIRRQSSAWDYRHRYHAMPQECGWAQTESSRPPNVPFQRSRFLDAGAMIFAAIAVATVGVFHAADGVPIVFLWILQALSRS